MPTLNTTTLCKEARKFSEAESSFPEPSLFGVTDGKAVGTYLEQKFRAYLLNLGYTFQVGNSAQGIDFPGLLVDMKVTSIRQPQSSCPFKSARQKIYGLGYSLLVFVYEKMDDAKREVGLVNILHTIFVEQPFTGDYHITKNLLGILQNEGNHEDLMAYLSDARVAIEEKELSTLASEVMAVPPKLGTVGWSGPLNWLPMELAH